MDPLNETNLDQDEAIDTRLPVQPFAAAQQPTTIPSPISSSRSESRKMKLDTLPLEIIRRIASHATCKGVLALQLVCRDLYHACSDVFIMKHILDRASTRNLYSTQHLRPVWYDGVLSIQSPFLSWARYVLAHEVMEQLIKDLEAKQAEVHFSQRRIASWLPQLLASHYPLQAKHEHSLEMYLFSELQDLASISPVEEQVIRFCLAVFKPNSRPRLRTLWNRIQRLYQIWDSHDHGMATVNAHSIIPEIQSVLEDWRREMPLNASHEIQPYPIGAELLFSTIMPIPLPFLESSATDFASCHLQTMTTQAFLVGDEWVGYYIYALGLSRLDPPMRSIIFESYTESVTPGLIELKAKGTDSVGDFTLVGEMRCNNGMLMFCKQYINLSHSWQYSGMMTPFGIVGKWYGLSDDGAGGLFWLWKAKWAHDLYLSEPDEDP